MNNLNTIGYHFPNTTALGLTSGNWQEDYVVSSQPKTDPLALLRHLQRGSRGQFIPSGVETLATKTRGYDKCFNNVTTSGQKELSTGKLGWSPEEALETRMRLRTFEEDWSFAGMEAYDEL
ncbi:MAG: hypothetical protein HZA78_04170 [Candidatus Schekmanbacteria bacterium]|nr:hypothetical protein [Candidatus Schekmanbacteria bacterium]